MTEVFEAGVLMGWQSLAFNPQGHQVKVFIPRRDEDIAADRARFRTAALRKAKICFDGCQYYISFPGTGTKSPKLCKTERNARRIANYKGYAVDPAPAQYVLPIYLDPTSETYRSA